MGLEESAIEGTTAGDPLPAEQEVQNQHIYDVAQRINFPKKVETLTEQNINFITSILEKIGLFTNLPPKQKQNLVHRFLICHSPAQQWLLKQGTPANYFFIIAEGQVDVIKNGYHIRSLGVGDWFGEMAILYGINRSSSVRVPKQYRGKNVYYALSRKYFMEAFQCINPSKNCQFLKLIENNLFFHYLTFSDKIQLAKSSHKISFTKNKRILSKYDQPYALFLIVEGCVQLTFPNKKQIQISRENLFGYFGSRNVECSASALTEVVVYAIGKDFVNKILKSNIKYLYLWNQLKFILINSPTTSSLSLKRVDQLTNLFNYKYAKDSQVICQYNTKIKFIYIPLSCRKKQNVELIGLKEKLEGKKKYQYDFVAEKSGYYAQINADLFVQIISNEDFKVGGDQDKTFDLTKSEILTIYPKQENKPESMLCRESKYNLHYILDVANVDSPIEVDYIKQQSQISEKVSCRFIRGHYFFIKRGREYLFGKQFIRGTKIKQMLMKIGFLPVSVVKFYISCVVVALEYLHNLGIHCTKLKLDSLKVDGEGYLWISDLSATTIISPIPIQNCQPKHPIQQRPPNNYCDLAEITYQLLIGKQINFRQLIGKSIQQLKQEIVLQNCLLNKQEKQLLLFLLNIRKGQNGQWSNIKQLGFFKGIDWNMLESKEMDAPVVPGFMFFDNSKI